MNLDIYYCLIVDVYKIIYIKSDKIILSVILEKSKLIDTFFYLLKNYDFS